jgi:hypothetical protein
MAEKGWTLKIFIDGDLITTRRSTSCEGCMSQAVKYRKTYTGYNTLMHFVVLDPMGRVHAKTKLPNESWRLTWIRGGSS